MNKMNWKWTLVCAAAVIGAAVLLDAVAWAGKPVPPTPPLVNPTEIKYQIQFWEIPDGHVGAFNGTNRWGDSVGDYGLGDSHDMTGTYYHAWLFQAPRVATPDIIWAIDLHAEMLDHHPELFDVGGILFGWVIASATDINDQGVIVGYLFPGPYNPDVSLGYVLDTKYLSPDVSSWTFRLLPPVALSSFSRPRRINEYGDIAGAYRKPDLTFGAYFISGVSGEVVELPNQNVDRYSLYMNNPDPDAGRAAQVVGNLSSVEPFCWTTGQPGRFEILPFRSAEGINDSGTISGSIYTRLGKGPASTYPLRYNAFREPPLEILPDVKGWGRYINSAGDLVIHNNDPRPYLYHDSWKSLKVDALIDPNDRNAAAWFSSGSAVTVCGFTDRVITDPSKGEETEFGLMSGQFQYLVPTNGVVNFLLIPVPKNPPTQQ